METIVKLQLPVFKDEQEESEFWDTHDSTQFLEETTPAAIRFSGPHPSHPRPRKVHISLRIDQETLDSLKSVAGQYGIGYQTLIRMWVMERLALQLKSNGATVDRGLLLPDPYSRGR